MISDAIIPSDDFFNEIGVEYEEAFGHDAGLRQIVQRFLEMLPANTYVLDCGCGTGKPVAGLIVESGRRVHGIDLSQNMVNLSRKQVPGGSFERTNMLDYSPTEDFHGIIAMLSLFELTREEVTTMAAKWFQWLCPNGMLLIGVFGAEDCETTPEMYDRDG